MTDVLLRCGIRRVDGLILESQPITCGACSDTAGAAMITDAVTLRGKLNVKRRQETGMCNNVPVPLREARRLCFP